MVLPMTRRGKLVDRWKDTAAEIRTPVQQALIPGVGSPGALGWDRLVAFVLLVPLIGFLDSDDGRCWPPIRAMHDSTP